jgi:hypothetical protein
MSSLIFCLHLNINDGAYSIKGLDIARHAMQEQID